ncbi:MAG: S41 family peptidase [Bryobacteraceae bacterium]
MLWPLALLLLQAEAQVSEIQRAIRTFAEAYSLIEGNAADQVHPDNAIYEAALPALMRRLDPHSAFLSTQQMEQLKEMERSTTKGFGTIVSVLPGRVIVLQTIAGSPSTRAGIAAGDEILGINNIRLDLLTMEQLVQVLGETRQRKALLHVRRPGYATLLQFTLTPEELAAPSVDRAYMLEPGAGYIRATSFDVETGKQVKEAIEKIGGASLKALVFDLRNNGGGVVAAALDTAALFLAPGQKILSARGRARKLEEVTVPEKAEPYKFPLVILINEKTASAAEIVTGALQDHDRATVIGTPSFGKGLVQSVYPLSQGTGMALTTAFYYTPSGRSIQKPLKESQLETALYANLEDKKEFKTDAGRAVKGGGGIEPDRVVTPERQTRLRNFLDASGALTAFATEFIKKNPAITREFQVTDRHLDTLQLYLGENKITPGVAEWSADRDWIRNRVHQEIFNQALGVAAGDEIESQRDPQVRAAVEALRK